MKQPYNTTIYNTALYLRLSRDDESYGDSVSIETQRTILQQYAKEHGLHVVGEYVDERLEWDEFRASEFSAHDGRCGRRESELYCYERPIQIW